MLQYIDHVNIVVSEMEASRQFYGNLLGLTCSFQQELRGAWVDEVTGLQGTVAECIFFELPEGRTRIELLQFRAPPGHVFPRHGDSNTIGVRHFAFAVQDLDAFVNRARANGIAFCSDPVTVPFPVGQEGREKRLCYFRDPDGVLLEVAEYAED
jgi:catechol 2,3-dioxygenase-like lactoylglutathione lyase family enzyme